MRSKSLRAFVVVATAVLLCMPALLNADVLTRPLKERIVLKTKDGMLHGVMPGCPPCAGLGVVVAAHNYPGSVDLYDATTGEKVGEIDDSRHAHMTCAETGQVPDVDTCFQQGLDVLPGTTLYLKIALVDDRGIDAFINIHAVGPTKVKRYGDGDKKTFTKMEIDNTALYGETDAGIPVTVQLGRSFGLEPTVGSAKRVEKGSFPDYVTMVVEANAQVTIGWPEEVSLEVSSEQDSEELAVTVLSSEEFDAVGQIDRSHLTFGPTGTEVALSTCVDNDVNADGHKDLQCQISARAQDIGFDGRKGHDAVVRGFTADGDPFEGRTSFSYGTRVATLPTNE